LAAEPFPSLHGLADRLRQAADRSSAHGLFEGWVRSQPDLLDGLRRDLRALTQPQAARLAAGSREVTTHFAWRLLDLPDDRFSLWLNEYKPQHDWLPGYGNTVHNHRYHFSTAVLLGSYWHEWFDAELDTAGELIRSVAPAGAEMFGQGPVAAIPADRFHRIPRAEDVTITLLAKSRPVKPWSLSFDPRTGVGRRHVPVEVRVNYLAERL
jgi:hypothetical protein